MEEIQKRYGLQGVQLALILLLVILLARQCRAVGEIVEDRREADSLIRVNDSLRHHLDSSRAALFGEIDSLNEAQRVALLQADTARQKIQRLSARSRGYRPATVVQIMPCDSLAGAYEDLTQTASTYMQIIDTLNREHQAELDARDSIILKQLELLRAMERSDSVMVTRYEILDKRYVKLEKTRKKNVLIAHSLNCVFFVAGMVVKNND